ncbi:HTH domain-containing protein [[Clostridium] aminophilum]
MSQETLGESIGVTRRVVQKYINVLKESGRIERVGGKRYGHWKIND